MSEQEKGAFEKELKELLQKYNVRLYQDRSDWKWYFMDGWDGDIYFPSTSNYAEPRKSLTQNC